MLSCYHIFFTKDKYLVVDVCLCAILNDKHFVIILVDMNRNVNNDTAAQLVLEV